MKKNYFELLENLDADYFVHHNESIEFLKSSEPEDEDITINMSLKQKRPALPGPWHQPCHLRGIELLQKELMDFLDYITPSSHEHQVRKWLIERVQSAIQTTIPVVKVVPVGSFCTDLYLSTSDIDLTLITKSNWDEITLLKKVVNVLHAFGFAPKNKILALFKAKVPIVKFTDLKSNISVDISVQKECGIQTIGIIESVLNEERVGKITKSLILLLKYFLLQNNMNEPFTGGLGSYAITLMVISFIQLNPNLQSMNATQLNQNFASIFFDLLDFYGNHFKYHTFGISLIEGGSYFEKEYENRLSIKDPLIPSHDVSQKSFRYDEIVELLSDTTERMENLMNSKEEWILSNIFQIPLYYYEKRDAIECTEITLNNKKRKRKDSDIHYEDKNNDRNRMEVPKNDAPEHKNDMQVNGKEIHRMRKKMTIKHIDRKRRKQLNVSVNSRKEYRSANIKNRNIPYHMDPVLVLPEELAVLIFSHLNDEPATLGIACRVSKTWYRIIQDHYLYKTICKLNRLSPIYRWSRYSLIAPFNEGSVKESQKCMNIENSSDEPLFAHSSNNWKHIVIDNFLTDVNWKKGKYKVTNVKGTFPRSNENLCLFFNEDTAISVSPDQPAVIWNLYSGDLKTNLIGHHGIVSSAKIHQNRIVTGGKDGTVRIWNLNGECLNVLTGHTDEIESIQYDGKRIISAGADGKIMIRNMPKLELTKVFSHPSAVTCIQYNQDYLFAGCADGSIQRWNLKTAQRYEIQAANEHPVYCLQIDSRYLLAGGEDALIRIFDIKTGQLMKSCVGHQAGVICLQFDEKKIVSGSSDRTIKIWSLENNQFGNLLYTLEKHLAPIWNLRIDRTKIMSSSFDMSVMVWDFGGKVK